MNHFKSLVSMLSICCLLGVNVAADPIDTVLSAGKVILVTPEKLLVQPQDSISEEEINTVVNNLANEDYFGHRVQADEVTYLVQESILLFANHGFVVFQYKPYYVLQNFGKSGASPQEIIATLGSSYNYVGPSIFFQYSINISGQVELQLFVNWAESYSELTSEQKKGLEDVLLLVFTKELKGNIQKVTLATAYAINKFNLLLSSPPKLKFSNSVNSEYFSKIITKASLVTQFQTFLKEAEQNNNVVVYIYSYSAQNVWFDLNGDIPNGNLAVTKLYTNKYDLTLDQGEYQFYAINLNEVDYVFSSGKKLLTVGIANELLHPDNHYLGNGGLKFTSIYQDQAHVGYYKLAQLHACETLIHECYAHCIPYLKGVLPSNTKSEEDHLAYFGNYSTSSPTLWEVLINSNKYRATPMFSIVKQLMEIFDYKFTILTPFPALPYKK